MWTIWFVYLSLIHFWNTLFWSRVYSQADFISLGDVTWTVYFIKFVSDVRKACFGSSRVQSEPGVWVWPGISGVWVWPGISGVWVWPGTSGLRLWTRQGTVYPHMCRDRLRLRMCRVKKSVLLVFRVWPGTSIDPDCAIAFMSAEKFYISGNFFGHLISAKIWPNVLAGF
jgi:hypothetical protein